MVPAPLALPEVDTVQITLLMDNAIDILMAGNEVTRRFPLVANYFDQPQPMAEHGFSVLISVQQGQKRGTVLFDTGASRTGLLHNMDVMDVDTHDIQAIVLSHGHADHALGLPGLITRLGPRGLPLVLHPDAFLERRLVLPDGTALLMPPPQKADLRQEGIEIIEEVGPSMLVDGLLLISGEVARVTPFESGLPIHQAKRHETWKPDPLIMDDQCAIINLRNKGLVVLTGCGHSGIINILRHAQALTGVSSIYAVVGGFHLTGNLFEPRIPETVAALQQFAPRYVMAGHCTGWRATQAIAQALPEAFIANSVGTTLNL